MTRDAGHAEDLVQETLLRAFRFWHKFEQGTNVKAWLFRIQTNIYINRYRKTQTEQQVIDDREAEDLLNRYAAEESTFLPPETRESFFKSVLLGRGDEGPRQLPFEFRMTVLLADMHEFSYKEIADRPGVPGRHGDEPPAPRPQAAASPTDRLRRRAWHRRQPRSRRRRCRQ
jgi:RNA polymerase sigma-70 factor (ECF subfamily)